ncbi:MAG: ribonuclease PH [Deltaproteobacteria bacterium]|nr:ribonuclease PH [Deltaproteobacteria bacterium]MBK8236412.1 ribonuclease PH [Deltaproteobacteria bacterium]MBK8717970.1 ribonuclease PH [Deltaproteobacteria bacterium]MBP7288366.1 ribonuclease PH [Nannocystaceae bacterium]
MRHDGRAPHQLRPCTIEPGFIGQALGSALIATGRTRVICTASVEERAPSWLQGGGWVTAQYAMLPGATAPRGSRDPGGRGKEIQRIIGRGLRAAVDLSQLVGPTGPLSIVCDCDVIEADGGTRTASITGAFVALSIALSKLRAQGRLATDPIVAPVAAVSVGLVGEAQTAMLDLAYEEDASAVVDLNVVALAGRGLVEVQGTGEHGTFSRAQLDALLDLAESGIASLVDAQRQALEGVR